MKLMKGAELMHIALLIAAFMPSTTVLGALALIILTHLV